MHGNRCRSILKKIGKMLRISQINRFSLKVSAEPVPIAFPGKTTNTYKIAGFRENQYWFSIGFLILQFTSPSDPYLMSFHFFQSHKLPHHYFCKLSHQLQQLFATSDIFERILIGISYMIGLLTIYTHQFFEYTIIIITISLARYTKRIPNMCVYTY